MIAETIGGKYVVMKKIGKGGFATIFSGFDTSLERPIAIKMLNDTTGDGNLRTSFLREAREMANLNHPNIVAVYDVAEHEGAPYMIMELVYGPTLLELVKDSTPTIPQLCTIARQICSGVKFGHDHGVIHGDLSLGNIMINDSGTERTVRVLDFGLARLTHENDVTAQRVLAGTPHYLAPEQINGEAYDGRADIFSFGVCFHRALNGFFPFDAEFPAALMYMTVHEENVPFADSVPEEIRRIVLRCLEKDPENRYRDFGEVITDLDGLQFSGGDSGDGGVPTVGKMARRSDRRRRRNPYLSRVMISDPRDFVGRQREVGRIYSRLDAPRPQSISVVGERTIGKSSLLHHIYQVENRKRHMSNHDDTIFVYMDFQQSLEFDTKRFIDFLFNMFSYERRSRLDLAGKDRTLDELRNVVRDLHDDGKRIVIVMDEFEVITRNPRFEGQFFALLRALANTYNVAYVTSSHEELQKLCHNKDISDSPFFNIFANLILGPFSRNEALELIAGPSASEGISLEPYADRIIEMAGLFPLFLQIACSATFETLMYQTDAEPDWNRVRNEFLEEVTPHYRSVWDHLDEPSRETLATLANGKAVGNKNAYVMEELARRGYILEDGGRATLCSNSFRDFVVEQAGDRGRGGLLRSLLRRGK